MMFKSGTALYSYEIVRQSGENIMYVNYLGASYVPSLADYADVMARTIDDLGENSNISRLVFVQQRNYSYDFSQVKMLVEISSLYGFLVKQEKILSTEKLNFAGEKISEVYAVLNYLINELFKQDPVRCYRELKSLLYEQRALFEKQKTNEDYVRFLERVLNFFDNLELIKKLKHFFDFYKINDRKIYSEVFRADVMPNFTFTRMIAKIPEDAEIIKQYEIGKDYDKGEVTIFKMKNKAKPVYHLTPSDYSLQEDKHMLLNLARNVLIEHQPKEEEFNDPERIRQVFFNVSRDLLQDLANSKNVLLSYTELNNLATILVRHTIGFGVIEVLLQDENLQDIVINSPVGLSPIFVRHNEFDECETNLIPSFEDAESWAAKFRMLSGRALDEANPILDTSLNLQEINARVAIIQNPLSVGGLAYAIRRHRNNPWTLPLFIKNKMINPLAAGLLSFLIDGARTMLIAGTRSSGKTSLLGSLMLEIMPKYRIITVEDSVSGDSSIIVKENGIFRKTTIGELINEKINKAGFVDIDGREKELNIDNLEIFSVDKDGKVVLSKPSKFIRHKNNKQIYEVKTCSGKKIKVTEDHSLFTFCEKNIMKPVKPLELKEGSFIAIPRKLHFDCYLDKINILSKLGKCNKKIFVLGKGISDFIDLNKQELFLLVQKHNKSKVRNWIKKKILPLEIFYLIKDKIDCNDLKIKFSNSALISSDILLDETFLNFVGLWLADGCYDKKSIIISVQEEENKEVVRKIAERFDINLKKHSDNFSCMLNSSILKFVMEDVLELKGNSYTKKIPNWAYNLSDKQIGQLLKGYFSGDGCASDKEVTFSTCSKNLLDDISSLLLRFGIVLRTSDIKMRDKTYRAGLGSVIMLKIFRDNIGFLVNYKNDSLDKLCTRISTHDSSDFIPFSIELKQKLKEIFGKSFNSNDYIKRENNIGRSHLSVLLQTNPVENLKRIFNAELFWDKVKSIKKVENEEYVFDISVPGNENFICENIVAHNTLELPVDSLRKLKYDILSMKVRSALMGETTEVSADEGIRASLRLGDSSLIIGEIRSEEAKALYEAMRVGALANVVAGTIHGASPYAVFDRVVNDLNVPVTSFKATDCIVVANPIKSPDGLHSWRRVLQISEVRKHWTKDPLDEKGFVDLMKYNVETDELEASEDLINGDSDMIKDIAANVKGWAGNWDAVWDNILLRAKIKKEIVDFSEKMKMPELLEYEFNVLSNNAFHEISEKVKEEVGLPVGEKVFPEWKMWLEREARKLSL